MSKKIKRSWAVALAVRVPRKVKSWFEKQAKKSKQSTSRYVSEILQWIAEEQSAA